MGWVVWLSSLSLCPGEAGTDTGPPLLDERCHNDQKDDSNHKSRRGGYRLSQVWDGQLAKSTPEEVCHQCQPKR